MTKVGTIKRRKPWLAAFLSLISPGWGQLYNGEWQKGLGLLVAEFAVGVFALMHLDTFSLFFGGIVLLLTIHCTAAAEAFITAKSLGEYTIQRVNQWWVYVLLLLLTSGLNTALKPLLDLHHKNYKVQSSSMLQTLHEGDRFIVELLDQSVPLKRGNVAIFVEPGGDKDFIKRVVGVPGDTLEIRNKVVLINGSELAEPYAYHSKTDYLPLRDDYAPVVLKSDEYFMMGDNRERSHDSRFFGPVSRAQIKGRAIYIYFPATGGSKGWLNRFGEKLR